MLRVISNYSISNEILENISNMNMTIVSIYICYCLYYQVDCLFIYNLLYVYILFDFLFIPFHRKDTILHHILVLLMFQYNSTYNIPVDNFSFPVTQLFKTEVSSVFLGTSYFLKKYKANLLICNASNMLFVSTFFYYRIYNFFFNVIYNPYFYQSITTSNTTLQNYYKYMLTYSLFGLNVFWSTRIISIVLKKKNAQVKQID